MKQKEQSRIKRQKYRVDAKSGSEEIYGACMFMCFEDQC